MQRSDEGQVPAELPPTALQVNKKHRHQEMAAFPTVTTNLLNGGYNGANGNPPQKVSAVHGGNGPPL